MQEYPFSRGLDAGEIWEGNFPSVQAADPTLLPARENVPPPRRPRRLSEELLDISQALEHEDIQLGQLITRLAGRVYPLLLVLLSVPFCQPVALPGLSSPFGVVIALFGLRYAFRQTPWLPQRLLRMKLPAKILPTLIRAGGKVLSWLEKLMHPRITWIFEYRLTQFLVGTTIFICGLLLLLPLPIPFSNLLPAITILLAAAAIAERDGVMLAASSVTFVATVLFFVMVFLGGANVVGWLESHFSGVFDPNDEIPIVDPALLPPTFPIEVLPTPTPGPTPEVLPAEVMPGPSPA